MHSYEIIKLYALNIYNFVCQLYLTKADEKFFKNRMQRKSHNLINSKILNGCVTKDNISKYKRQVPYIEKTLCANTHKTIQNILGTLIYL